jgi:hypothetical protein
MKDELLNDLNELSDENRKRDGTGLLSPLEAFSVMLPYLNTCADERNSGVDKAALIVLLDNAHSTKLEATGVDSLNSTEVIKLLSPYLTTKLQDDMEVILEKAIVAFDTSLRTSIGEQPEELNSCALSCILTAAKENL